MSAISNSAGSIVQPISAGRRPTRLRGPLVRTRIRSAVMTMAASKRASKPATSQKLRLGTTSSVASLTWFRSLTSARLALWR